MHIFLNVVGQRVCGCYHSIIVNIIDNSKEWVHLFINIQIWFHVLTNVIGWRVSGWYHHRGTVSDYAGGPEGGSDVLRSHWSIEGWALGKHILYEYECMHTCVYISGVLRHPLQPIICYLLTYANVRVCEYMHIQTYVYMHLCIYTYVYMYINKNLCISMCLYAYMISGWHTSRWALWSEWWHR
jgi:hypothetical protein